MTLQVIEQFMSPHGFWRMLVFTSVESVVFAALYFASRPERRRLLDALRLGGATNAETAMTPYELAGEQSDALQSLLQEGLVVTTSDGQIYLDQQRADAESDTPRNVGLGVLAFIAFCVGAWLIFNPS